MSLRLIAFVLCGASWMNLSAGLAAEAPRYNREVRPILAEHCFRCHGPDSALRKGELRLDRRELAIEKQAIRPGDAEHGGVIERIFSADPEEVMPPPATHKDLSAAEKETLKRWIAAGAEYEPHWSFLAPRRGEPPAVKNEAWPRNAIDRFVLARLEAEGLEPAPEADRRVLARCLSLDLTGLPPAPEDVDQFVADPSIDAYERYVDRLLTLPSWGEHRARYWLDAARYADTHGIHFDNYREMWLYRDWVIDAFNRNKPFDRFTIEQLAGDLLPDATLEQQIASGFNRCNITTNEGGAIDEEYLVLYDRDRTETTAQVWLGLTAGCAVCHDHKFDPLSQREFYELAAFFNNTPQRAYGRQQKRPTAGGVRSARRGQTSVSTDCRRIGRSRAAARGATNLGPRRFRRLGLDRHSCRNDCPGPRQWPEIARSPERRARRFGEYAGQRRVAASGGHRPAGLGRGPCLDAELQESTRPRARGGRSG